jgi:hypothetical protein
MSTPQRRNLLEGLAPTPAPAPPPALAETAARRGFTSQAAQVATTQDNAAGRQRQKIGRDHMFSTRLRADTRAAIYDQANARNVPVAQVIEEAMAALEAAQAGRGRA